MKKYKTLDYNTILIYISMFVAIFFLYYTGDNGEPYGLALLYSMCGNGLNPFISGFLYIISSLTELKWSYAPIYLVQGAIISIIFFFLSKQNKKLTIIPILGMCLSLSLFIIFSPFKSYSIPFDFDFLQNTITQKIIISGIILLLSSIFTISLKAILTKLLKCRLKTEEIIFSIILYVLIGLGICKFLGLNAYMGISFFILLLYARSVKDTTTLLCAFSLSLPSYIIFRLSPERFFIYGIITVIFSKSGRLPMILGLLTVFFSYGYFDGIYFYPTNALISTVLSIIIPSLLFLLIPSPLIRKIENKLIFYREKHLSRIAINRNRSSIGEQLFEISAVFREIQTTFASLGTNEAEEGAKEYIRGQVIENVCKKCPQFNNCLKLGLENSLNKLIDVGCVKGRTSLIDIPKDLADICINQSGVLYIINRQITDYKKYMLETENAADGRQLLAKQAQGISEIVRNIAIEQSEPLTIYTEKERQLNIAFLKSGIVCSEVLISGEGDDITLSLVTFGNKDVKKIAAIASHILSTDLIISEKLTLNKNKFCCILRKRPFFDAAFGVSTMMKYGETASGDTHSVIKIDERRFMVALSDGMGSGEYAKKISESTISLLESFYRAKMPSSLVLSTINKLLTFSSEETFACVDIAIINLDSGRADIVKIGSPMGFIFSGNTLKILDSNSLPLGILESLHPDTSSYTLKLDDVLLFLSDGITSAFGSSSDLYETLKTIPISNPQQLSDLLLNKALERYGGKANDDMTVLAVRLFKNAA